MGKSGSRTLMGSETSLPPRGRRGWSWRPQAGGWTPSQSGFSHWPHGCDHVPLQGSVPATRSPERGLRWRCQEGTDPSPAASSQPIGCLALRGTPEQMTLAGPLFLCAGRGHSQQEFPTSLLWSMGMSSPLPGPQLFMKDQHTSLSGEVALLAPLRSSARQCPWSCYPDCPQPSPWEGWRGLCCAAPRVGWVSPPAVPRSPSTVMEELSAPLPAIDYEKPEALAPAIPAQAPGASVLLDLQAGSSQSVLPVQRRGTQCSVPWRGWLWWGEGLPMAPWEHRGLCCGGCISPLPTGEQELPGSLLAAALPAPALLTHSQP